jgi:hypothetical protein
VRLFSLSKLSCKEKQTRNTKICNKKKSDSALDKSRRIAMAEKIANDYASRTQGSLGKRKGEVLRESPERMWVC